MKKILLIFIVFSSLALAHAGGLDKDGGHYNRKTGEYHKHQSKEVNQDEIKEELVGRVLYVPDGDTIHIEVNGEKKKIRFYGIDCPESTQAYGLEAKEFLMNNMDKNEVRIEVVDIDRYGRIVGKVYSRGIYLNELLVEEGYAWWYERYAKNDKRFGELEEEARKSRKGLWKQSNPEAPWDYRKNK